MGFQLSVDQRAIAELSRRVALEEDGKVLRRELSAGLRKAMDPMKTQAMHNVQALHSVVPIHANTTRQGGKKVAVADSAASLRTAVAGKIQAQGRLTGRSTGARLRVGTSGMPRGFKTAARHLNRAAGWRHPVFRRTVWVRQLARPVGWFDRATHEPSLVADALAAAEEAVVAMAHRIAGE